MSRVVSDMKKHRPCLRVRMLRRYDRRILRRVMYIRESLGLCYSTRILGTTTPLSGDDLDRILALRSRDLVAQNSRSAN